MCCVINIPNGFLTKSDLTNIDRRITIIITIIITFMCCTHLTHTHVPTRNKHKPIPRTHANQALIMILLPLLLCYGNLALITILLPLLFCCGNLAFFSPAVSLPLPHHLASGAEAVEANASVILSLPAFLRSDMFARTVSNALLSDRELVCAGHVQLIMSGRPSTSTLPSFTL